MDARIGLRRSAFDPSVSTGVPSLAKVLSLLNMAFIGNGLVRYGPYSAELDIQYVSASQKHGIAVGPNGRQATLESDVSMVHLAPGIGYQVLPTGPGSTVTLDARAGFQFMSVDASSGFANSPFGGVSRNISYAGPWLGLRGS